MGIHPSNVAARSYIQMTQVGIRELKNRLSHYIRIVKGGEAIHVTDRGEVVAELVPPGSGRADNADPDVEALRRLGDFTIGEPNRQDLYGPRQAGTKPGTAQRLLDEERGDR